MEEGKEEEGWEAWEGWWRMVARIIWWWWGSLGEEMEGQ